MPDTALDPILEFAETGEKAEWTTAYVNDLPDSAFLYIGSGGKKDDQGKTTPRSLRKFPYKAADGSVDLPHLRNAIARIPQADIPAGEKSALQERAQNMLGRATGASKEIEMEEHHRPWGGATTFQQVREMRQAYAAEGAMQDLATTYRHLVDNILADEMISMDAKPDRIIALTQELKREITPAVENAVAQVKETDRPTLMGRVKDWFLGHAPELEPQSTFRLFKTKEGDWRWLAVWSNHFEDRDGELFTLDSHKDYIAWCDETGYRPELRWWHVPGTRIGETKEIAITDDGFLLAEGTIDEGARAQAERLASGELGSLAVSHGYSYDAEDLVDGAYKRYRSFEISVLPAYKAANPYTGWTAGQEVPMITDAKKRATIVQLWGEPFTKELEAKLSSAAKTLKAQGVSFKEVMDEAVNAAIAAADTPPPAAAAPASASGEPSLATVMHTLTELTNQLSAVQTEQKAIRDAMRAAPTAPAPDGDGHPPRNMPAFIASTAKETQLGDPSRMSDSELLNAAAAAEKAMAAPGQDPPEKAATYLQDIGLSAARA